MTYFTIADFNLAFTGAPGSETGVRGAFARICNGPGAGATGGEISLKPQLQAAETMNRAASRKEVELP